MLIYKKRFNFGHPGKEMLVMARFILPRDFTSENALETLKTIKGNKAVLCLGGGP